jgi:hypothetical protein
MSPLAVVRPNARMSLITITRPASFWPPAAMRYSAACFTELMVSAPALARPMICAFELCARNRNDEKSLVLSGCRTSPTTLPPLVMTTLLRSLAI